MPFNPVDKLESQLEAFIEGAFTRIFRRSIQARDIAVLLLRAMEAETLALDGSSSRALPPLLYEIRLHPEIARQVQAQQPDTEARLAKLIVELGKTYGYQHRIEPQARLLEDTSLARHQASVSASLCPLPAAQTAAMPPVLPEARAQSSQQPLLILKDTQVFVLAKAVINIGRGAANDIVLADAQVSRHHLQLRRRGGAYMLFDVNSRGGTRVNATAVREHRLQNGDLIQIGGSALVFAEQAARHSYGATTQVMLLE